MSLLLRQTYTNISLVAMLPAAVWAIAAHSAQNLAQTVGGFPFYYLFVCQVLVLPRYVFGAFAVERLSRSKRFNIWAGMIGLIMTGFIVDIVLTVWFAAAIADPSHARPFIIPLMALPIGFIAMTLTAVVAGYTVQNYRGPKRRK